MHTWSCSKFLTLTYLTAEFYVTELLSWKKSVLLRLLGTSDKKGSLYGNSLYE